MYAESLKKGFVESSNTVCLLNGAAGTGKTHVKCLISKQRPNKVRHSTPVSEAPVRAFTCNRYDPTNEEWHEIDDDKEIEFLAAKMAEGVPLEEIPSTSVSPQVGTSPPLASDSSSHMEESATLQQQGGSQSQSSKADPDESLKVHDPLDIVRYMSLTEKSKPYRNVDWVFIFDSGGQPAFHEMMPFFFP